MHPVFLNFPIWKYGPPTSPKLASGFLLCGKTQLFGGSIHTFLFIINEKPPFIIEILDIWPQTLTKTENIS